ncbi:uncharacterized protein [Gossypium hirsutum]|uniref:Uncharacterized protein n=1 Tax=Gossypium hirsutum TaxID=3635 RepID=A0A1U8NNY4_GOSHI|nr:uncharacterized protein LOC107950266 [Gossypium hirsutum]
MSGNRMPMKTKSCNYDADRSNSAGEVDVSNGKILARTTSWRSRIFGLVFGRRSMKEDGYQEAIGAADVMRLDPLERAEIAADLLEVKWSTNIISNRSNTNGSGLPSTNDALDNKGYEEHTLITREENQFQSSVHDEEGNNNVEENQFHSAVYHEENGVGHMTLLEETECCNEQNGLELLDQMRSSEILLTELCIIH